VATTKAMPLVSAHLLPQLLGLLRIGLALVERRDQECPSGEPEMQRAKNRVALPGLVNFQCSDPPVFQVLCPDNDSQVAQLLQKSANMAVL